jgi:hypothetical protein
LDCAQARFATFQHLTPDLATLEIHKGGNENEIKLVNRSDQQLDYVVHSAMAEKWLDRTIQPSHTHLVKGTGSKFTVLLMKLPIYC